MAHAQAAVNVYRSAQEVFDFLADGTNNPKWHPGILNVQKVTDGDVGVGTRFAQTIQGKGRFSRPVRADYEITVFEPGQILGFKLTAGPLRAEGRYMIGSDEGTTTVQFDLQLPPITLFQKFKDKSMQKALEQDVLSIRNLPQLLGGTPPEEDGQ